YLLYVNNKFWLMDGINFRWNNKLYYLTLFLVISCIASCNYDATLPDSYYLKHINSDSFVTSGTETFVGPKDNSIYFGYTQCLKINTDTTGKKDYPYMVYVNGSSPAKVAAVWYYPGIHGQLLDYLGVK